MTGAAEPDRRALLRDALKRLEEMQARVAAYERARSEPIAIVGMACRFPGGVDGPEAFWQMLRDGRDAIREVPADRWDVDAFYDPDPAAPGKICTRFGGFVSDHDRFDAEFFGIAPREAVSMDPQHRLLLEVAWHALEDAALTPGRLEGSRSGVFVGITVTDYNRLLELRGTEHLDAYNLTGGCLNFAAGRIAYVLGLQGPTMAVDTACSSSLVAVHLACQSLRNDECGLALAGGVNLILGPEFTIAVSKARLLAPDGRCKTFDASADGFVRAEGCGVVVLKRLSDAQADGDRVLALIRGSAVNQDGRSSGLTAPNKRAQEVVIREALSRAAVRPSEVGYVEAHGTGTALGDPIEVRALQAVLGEGRSRPFALGSVKTNIGHLESAAGVAGLMKVVQILRHGEIPPHLHLKEKNPNVAWHEVAAVIPTSLVPWPSDERPRIASVSAFGASGTNAHAVLEEAPGLAEREPGVERSLHLLTLSAKDAGGLSRVAGRLRERVVSAEEPLGDVCYTANAGRAQHAVRAAVVAGTKQEVGERLRAVAEGLDAAWVVRGEASGTVAPEVAFLFTGQGSQYAGMGRELFETQPTFRAALTRCAEVLRPLLAKPLLAVLYPESGETSLIDETAYTQPSLFALEWSLSELWRSWGVEPAVVLGHSVGEYVAACVAGVFTLEDGLKLIAERGRLMQALPSGGEMAAVFAGEQRVGSALSGQQSRVSLAAVNGPESVVISGAGDALREVLEGLSRESVKSQRLKVSHAFHSPLMEPMLLEFERVARGVSYGEPRLGLVSNLTGRLVSGREASEAGYWVRHVREAVRFSGGIETLHALGNRVYVEVGPSPVLLGLGKRCVSGSGQAWLPTLRGKGSDWGPLLSSVAELWVRGVGVDWQGFDRDYARRKVSLPTYPFERKRFWVDDTGARLAARPRSSRGSHPLLGARLRSASREVAFESSWALERLGYLEDHRVADRVVVPGSALIETALAAGRERFRERAVLQDLFILEPLFLNASEPCVIQSILTPEGADHASLEIASLAGDDAEGPWRRHMTGRLVKASNGAGQGEDLEALRGRCRESIAPDAHYAALERRGLRFGSRFRGVREIWKGEGEVLAAIELRLEDDAGYALHPARLDACLQPLGALLPGGLEGTDTYLPVAAEFVRLTATPPGELWSHVRLRPAESSQDPHSIVDVRVLRSGEVVAELRGFRLRRAAARDLRPATESPSDEGQDLRLRRSSLR